MLHFRITHECNSEIIPRLLSSFYIWRFSEYTTWKHGDQTTFWAQEWIWRWPLAFSWRTYNLKRTFWQIPEAGQKHHMSLHGGKSRFISEDWWRHTERTWAKALSICIHLLDSYWFYFVPCSIMFHFPSTLVENLRSKYCWRLPFLRKALIPLSL